MKSITLEKIIRFAIGIGGLSIAGIILYNYSTIVGYAAAAILLSYILDPIVNRLQSWGLNRTLSIALTLSTVILFLVFVSTSIIPIIGTEMIALTSQLDIQNLQVIASKIEEQLVERYEFIPPNFLTENITQGINENLNFGRLSDVVSNVIGVFTNVFSAFLVIPFATFFFLKDGTMIRRRILRLVPNKYFETTLSLLDKVEKRLSIYFKSILLQSFLVATFSYLFLSIAGLGNALSVGIAVGVANTIPYFGPILGYGLSAVVSILETGDFSLVGYCLLAIFAVQIMDNVIFQPLIFSKSADMHPVAILFIILIGAQTAGILGMLIAIPIATTIKITINQISWSLKNYRIFKSEVSSGGA
jgi:predicted PurR-regulated permease PerM